MTTNRAPRASRRPSVFVIVRGLAVLAFVVLYFLALAGVGGTVVQAHANSTLDGVIASVLVLLVPRFFRGRGRRAER